MTADFERFTTRCAAVWIGLTIGNFGGEPCHPPRDGTAPLHSSPGTCKCSDDLPDHCHLLCMAGGMEFQTTRFYGRHCARNSARTLVGWATAGYCGWTLVHRCSITRPYSRRLSEHWQRRPPRVPRGNLSGPAGLVGSRGLAGSTVRIPSHWEPTVDVPPECRA